jgi:hypothetical protein
MSPTGGCAGGVNRGEAVRTSRGESSSGFGNVGGQCRNSMRVARFAHGRMMVGQCLVKLVRKGYFTRREARRFRCCLVAASIASRIELK